MGTNGHDRPSSEIVNDFYHEFNKYQKNGNGKEKDLMAELEATRYDYNCTEEIHPNCYLTIGQTSYDILAPGQIMCMTGEKKAGKSFILENIICSGLCSDKRLNFSLFTQQKKTLWFDTEQSMYFYRKNQRRIMNQAGMRDNDYGTYEAFLLRQFSCKERLKMIMKKTTIEPNVGAVVIDGIVDLIDDFNNTKEVRAVLNDLMALTVEKDINMFVVLHFNPGTTKMRGHSGTEVHNKSDQVIAVKKESQFTYKVWNHEPRFLPFPSWQFERRVDGTITML